MSETLSAVMTPTRDVREEPALYVGLAADAPRTPSLRVSLRGIERVDVGRGASRSVRRTADGLAIELADARLSTAHAALIRTAAGWQIADRGSKNGTWVNARRIGEHRLATGDAILVGHTMLVFATGGEDGKLAASAADAFGGATMSPALAARFLDCLAAARTAIPIEITGETGTGKELAARAVHASSGRTGRFVAVNCAALPPNLLEGELFGHRKGAYTGAEADRTGLVRSADGGTLFLDEVADLPLGSQAALLRVLQEGEVVPLGGDRAIPVDLRLVTATHKPLDAEVAADRFRADLRARLLGLHLVIPPLRDRRCDLGLLVGALLDRLASGRTITFSADAALALYRHTWPLNIRELERALAAALAIAGERIELHHLPLALRAPIAAAAPVLDDAERALRDQLAEAIARHAGNLAAVARELGKDRTQIRRWMQRLGLDRG